MGSTASESDIDTGERTDDSRSDTDPEIVRTIGHDEYNPTGTLVLIAMYFTILAVLWLFMYFVEFLGNDPTVIGA